MENKELKFDEQLLRLETLVNKIESGDLSLEDSLKYFEEGKAIISQLNKTLLEAKEKIEKYKTIE